VWRPAAFDRGDGVLAKNGQHPGQVGHVSWANALREYGRNWRKAVVKLNECFSTSGRNLPQPFSTVAIVRSLDDQAAPTHPFHKTAHLGSRKPDLRRQSVLSNPGFIDVAAHPQQKYLGLAQFLIAEGE
jgi:hypothetical protein